MLINSLHCSKNYSIFSSNAFIVPETAKTCNVASLPATLVMDAKEDLTIFKVASEVRITAILRSISKLINAKLVKLAPTSP